MSLSFKEVYSSAENVYPLLVGAEIPSMSLTRRDGSPCELAELIKTKPSVIIFYRGGW
jgi:peroxiredoxin